MMLGSGLCVSNHKNKVVLVGWEHYNCSTLVEINVVNCMRKLDSTNYS